MEKKAIAHWPINAVLLWLPATNSYRQITRSMRNRSHFFFSPSPVDFNKWKLHAAEEN